MIASVFLRELADKIEKQEGITAIDLFRLNQVAEALIKKYGYDDLKDPILYLDAVEALNQEEEKKHARKES